MAYRKNRICWTAGRWHSRDAGSWVTVVSNKDGARPTVCSISSAAGTGTRARRPVGYIGGVVHPIAAGSGSMGPCQGLELAYATVLVL